MHNSSPPKAPFSDHNPSDDPKNWEPFDGPPAEEVPASVLAIAEGVLEMIWLKKKTLQTAGVLMALGAGVLGIRS